MGSLIDLTGRRFGRLVVIKRAQDYIYRSGRREPAWKCICDCGKEIDVLGNSLRTGSTNSYGVSKTMSEWSDVSGVSSSTILARMNRYGWDAAKAVLTPTGTGATNVR